MTPRRACFLFAALTLALAIAGVVMAPRTCGDDRGLGPVLGLELAVNATELSALVTTPECASGLRQGTWGDMFGFIPAFTGFLVCGALVLMRRHRLALAAVPMFVLAAVSDEVEDVVMLRLLEMPSVTVEWLSALVISVRFKFLLLSAGVIVLGVVAQKTERVLGLVMISGGALALCGLAFSHRLLMPGTLFAWIGLLVMVVRAR